MKTLRTSCIEHIKKGVTTIEEYAFAECSGIKTLVLPSGLTSISANSFAGMTSLEYVIIPSGINSITAGAFASVNPNCVVYYGKPGDTDATMWDSINHDTNLSSLTRLY